MPDNIFKTALAEAAGGAVAGSIADGVLYSIDSAKVQAQAVVATTKKNPTTATTISHTKGGGIRVLFRGFVPTILLGSVPVFGSFFFLYAPIRDTLRNDHYKKEEFIPIASMICAIPATIIGVPSDVLKKRLVLGLDKNVSIAIRSITVGRGGWKGLFAGWHVNLIRDLPFAGVKIGLYEAFVHHYIQLLNNNNDDDMEKINEKKISPMGAAVCGVTSGIVCGVITCPLDVINTRIKAGCSNNNTTTSSSSSSIVRVGCEIVRQEGVLGLFRGVFMRSFLLGVGSSIFWPIQRTVSQSFFDIKEENLF